MFRYINLLRKPTDDKIKEIFDTLAETENKPVVEPYRSQLYSYDIYNTIKMFAVWYDQNAIDNDTWSDFVRNVHPFDKIKTEITSDLLPKDKNKVTVTNAFTKMYEFLTYFEPRIQEMVSHNKNTLTMYDIASAPGMFILATEYFCKKRKIKVDWQASSAPETENSKFLTDSYGLFATNPDRYEDCDVTSPLSVMNILQKHSNSYMLVTGDIGQEVNSSKHSELACLDIQYGQAVMALNLCAPGGMVYLKMFSYMTKESLLVLDLLTCFFEEVYICKPCTSRLINQESYIIGVGKLSTEKLSPDCSVDKIPLSRPSLQEVDVYTSLNRDIATKFDIERFNYRNAFCVYMLTKIKGMAKGDRTIKNMNADLLYKTFYAQAMKVLNLITSNGDKINYASQDDKELIRELQYVESQG